MRMCMKLFQINFMVSTIKSWAFWARDNQLLSETKFSLIYLLIRAIIQLQIMYPINIFNKLNTKISAIFNYSYTYNCNILGLLTAIAYNVVVEDHILSFLLAKFPSHCHFIQFCLFQMIILNIKRYMIC